MLDAVNVQGRGHHGHARARHNALEHVLSGVNPSGDGQVNVQVAVENRRPVQTRQQLRGSREVQRGPHFQGLDVEVGLIEAVEQHHSACASFLQPPDQIRNAGKRLGELDRHRNLDRPAHAAHQFQQLQFELRGGLAAVRGQCVGVQFDGVGPGLLHVLGKPHPASGRGSVQAGQNRNPGRLLALPQVFQVHILRHAVVVQVGQVAQRLGKGLGAPREVVVQRL